MHGVNNDCSPPYYKLLFVAYFSNLVISNFRKEMVSKIYSVWCFWNGSSEFQLSGADIVKNSCVSLRQQFQHILIATAFHFQASPSPTQPMAFMFLLCFCYILKGLTQITLVNTVQLATFQSLVNLLFIPQ